MLVLDYIEFNVAAISACIYSGNRINLGSPLKSNLMELLFLKNPTGFSWLLTLAIIYIGISYLRHQIRFNTGRKRDY